MGHPLMIADFVEVILIADFVEVILIADFVEVIIIADFCRSDSRWREHRANFSTWSGVIDLTPAHIQKTLLNFSTFESVVILSSQT